jgi:hypothetical protein
MEIEFPSTAFIDICRRFLDRQRHPGDAQGNLSEAPDDGALAAELNRRQAVAERAALDHAVVTERRSSRLRTERCRIGIRWACARRIPRRSIAAGMSDGGAARAPDASRWEMLCWRLVLEGSLARMCYVVGPNGVGGWQIWQINSAEKVVGPYTTRAKAIRAAVDAAHAEGEANPDGAQVLVQERVSQFRIEWTYGHDPYPPPA